MIIDINGIKIETEPRILDGCDEYKAEEKKPEHKETTQE